MPLRNAQAPLIIFPRNWSIFRLVLILLDGLTTIVHGLKSGNYSIIDTLWSHCNSYSLSSIRVLALHLLQWYLQSLSLWITWLQTWLTSILFCFAGIWNAWVCLTVRMTTIVSATICECLIIFVVRNNFSNRQISFVAEWSYGLICLSIAFL